jgi:trans-aconitate methyltransferase
MRLRSEVASALPASLIVESTSPPLGCAQARSYHRAMTGQVWDPDSYARNARFVADLGAPVVDLLAPRAGERILDLGCGDGVLTAKLVACGCEVVGVDASPRFVEAARALGIDSHVMDGEALDFAGEFDAVFSNAALHWMRRADAVITGVHRALRPGGRFVAEFGGHRCVATIREALIAALDRRGIDGAAFDPWFFPTADDYRARLERAGFVVDSIAVFPRPTQLPSDILGWLETFAHAFVQPLAEPERAGYLDEVRRALQPALCDASGTWTADYTRLRFSAHRPAH